MKKYVDLALTNETNTINSLCRLIFIKKGGENRLCETLATAAVGKVLIPAKELGI